MVETARSASRGLWRPAPPRRPRRRPLPPPPPRAAGVGHRWTSRAAREPDTRGNAAGVSGLDEQGEAQPTRPTEIGISAEAS